MPIACLLLAVSIIAASDEPKLPTVEAAAREALASLPGQTCFAFTELTDARPVVLAGIRSEERLAVGSSFKLFILGTLIDEVNHGRRRADNTMLLSRDHIGPPYSDLATWPIGSPVTLHTLALKMISVSDNTATDHLLYLLGRRRVERQMAAMGHGDPSVNRPLLSTREMTMLRDKARDRPGREYQRLDTAGRRAMLARLGAGPVDYDKLDFDTGAYSLAEWYASPLDMTHALDWIYRHTAEGQPAHELRAILTVEPKLPHDPAVWPFVGFKGGSEDQLLAGNWLLENRNGHWYTLHVFWNNPDGTADQEKLVAAVEKIFAAIQTAIEPK